MKNEKCILLMCNKKYFFALCVFIKNISAKCSWFDIVIYDDGSLTQRDRNTVISIYSKTNFITCSYSMFLEKYSLKHTTPKKNFIERFSHLEYLKFEIFNLLESYESVALFDIDIYITNNIDEIFNFDCDIAWRNSTCVLNKINPIIKTEKFYIDEFCNNITDKTIAPNGGLIIVNKKFDYTLAYQYGKELLRKLISLQGSMIDEIIFSLICVKMKLRILQLDPKIYNVSPLHISNSAKIIHFAGAKFKPWNNIILQGFFKEWVDIYIDNLKMYDIKSNDIIYDNYGDDLLKKTIYMHAWCSIMTDARFEKIPKELILKRVFTNQFLSFEFSPNLCYDINYKIEDNSFYIVVKIFGKLAISSKEVDVLVNEILKDVPCLKQKKEKNILYIFSNNFKKEDIFHEFYYIYKKTEKLQKIL